MKSTLDRRTFVISRGLEYFTESELQMQIGHRRDVWPVAILKELIDNALDAAEAAGRAPRIHVEITDEGFSVEDNGPGLPDDTLRQFLDYLVRASDKLAYVTPTRGRLGNALKVVWAAPFVATGRGHVTVTVADRVHTITVDVDPIEQRPTIECELQPLQGMPAIDGTRIEVGWPDSASCLREAGPPAFYKSTPSAKELIQAYAAFNPPAHFSGQCPISPTTRDWKKWRPTDKLVAHWYTPETFRELVANYIASERYGAEPITVRAFVAGFRGLTSTVKQKAVTEGLQRAYLHDLTSDASLDTDALTLLLQRMQDESRPVKPAALGVIGEGHLRAWMAAEANAAADSIRYRKYAGTEDERFPYVVEVAFGVSTDDDAHRRIVTGLNWSPTLGVPAREIQQVLQEMRVDPHDPVVVLIHMAQPTWKYTGRGKETVAL